jgi:hypothetical protein
MKKLIRTTAAAALTVAMILTLGAAGGQDDPLITLSRLNGEYRAELAAELDVAVTRAFDAEYARLTARLGAGGLLVPPVGYTRAVPSVTEEILPGQTLSLAPGAIFTLKSGETSGVISAGSTLDLTEGTSLSGTFTIVRGHRYMVPEGGAVSFASVGAAAVSIDGYRRFDGEALEHHPVFTDVGARVWFYPAVDFVYVNKLYNGVSPTEFAPDMPMTRAMFVTVLGRLEGIDPSQYASIGDANDAAPADNTPTDRSDDAAPPADTTPEQNPEQHTGTASDDAAPTNSHPAESTPPGDDTPSPNPELTEPLTGEASTEETPAEETSIGETPTGETPVEEIPAEQVTADTPRVFPDVSPDAYYAPYVAWAASEEIVLGYDDGTFGPDDTITREQMTTVMYRYALWLGEDLSFPEDTGAGFSDIGSVADYAIVSVKWAVSRFILAGSDGKLMPRDTATRAQVAQIIKNFISR